MPLLFKRIARDRARDREEKALDQITHWSMLLDIAVAVHSYSAQDVRRINNELQQLRRRIKLGDEEPQSVDLEFHRKLAEINKRRRQARKVV